MARYFVLLPRLTRAHFSSQGLIDQKTRGQWRKGWASKRRGPEGAGGLREATETLVSARLFALSVSDAPEGFR